MNFLLKHHCTQLLLDFGAKLDIEDGLEHLSAIHWGCKNGDVDTVGVLLKAGANTSQPSSKTGATALKISQDAKNLAILNVIYWHSMLKIILFLTF